MASDQPIIIKKKKGGHGGGHHGGSWKVAYADFVTAMMAFFMVMWILGLSDDAKIQISGYFNDPFGYSKTSTMSRNIVKFPGSPVTSGGTIKRQKAEITKADKRSVVKVQTEIERQIEEALRKGIKPKDGAKGLAALAGGSASMKELLEHIDVTVTDEGLRIEMMEDTGSVFFQTGSAEMKPLAKRVIKELAPILGEAGRKMRLEGHTDARPYGAGADYDNWDLSQDRANALRRELRKAGLGPDRFDQIAGYADERLKLPNDPMNPKNRRVSILLPFSEGGGDVDITAGLEPKKQIGDVEIKPSINISEDKPVKPAPDRKPKPNPYKLKPKAEDGHGH